MQLNWIEALSTRTTIDEQKMKKMKKKIPNLISVSLSIGDQIGSFKIFWKMINV